MSNNSKGVPIWRKYSLTIEEASMYFGIGEKVFRRFIKEHIDDEFVFCNGSKVLIKRAMFERYMDEHVTAI